MRSHKEVIAYLMALRVKTLLFMNHNVWTDGQWLSQIALEREIDNVLFDLARPVHYSLEKRPNLS